jgi:predicted amidohydrolase
MRIAVMQLAVDLDQPLADRVADVADRVRAQRGADLVVLPELWAHGAFAYQRWADEAEPLDGLTVTALQAAARDLGAHVHMGSIMERSAGGLLFNTSLLLGRDGEVLTTYRKIHRFGFSEGEATLIEAGRDVVVYDGELGALGLSTCYDLRFPELYRTLLDRGAEVVLVVAGWPDKRIEHWRLLAQARAIEDQVHLVACNTAGEQVGVRMGGHSLVVDCWGKIVAEAGTGDEVLVVDVDVTEVPKTRDRFPVLKDRRL